MCHAFLAITVAAALISWFDFLPSEFSNYARYESQNFKLTMALFAFFTARCQYLSMTVVSSPPDTSIACLARPFPPVSKSFHISFCLSQVSEA